MNNSQKVPAADSAHQELIHELRIPLTVLMGRVQLLRRRRLLSREPFCRDDELEAIEAAIVRLAAAVDRVDRAEQAFDGAPFDRRG